MAGIGFRLQKLVSGGSYTDLVRAYLYSSFICTGPMLVVIVSLAVVNRASQVRLTVEEQNLIMGLIVYIYAFSMLGVGPVLYVVTRYLADNYYLKKVETFTPTYLASLVLVFAVQSLVALAFLARLPLVFSEKWMLLALYLEINGIWIAMIFLSAARSYVWIFWAYLAGGVVGIGLATVLGRQVGFSGFLNGYTIGQGITFLILTVRIFLEFGFSVADDWGFLSYFRKYIYLVLVGFFYYLGVWIDKFIFWFSPKGISVASGIHIMPDYDTPMFLSFLTIVPSMAFFLIQMETSFVRHYRAYFESIRNREDFGVIRERTRAMMENLTRQFQKYALFQGILSGAVILSLYEIAEAFYLNPYQLGIFRIGILGAFLLMGFLMMLGVLFYFDFQKEIFWVTCLFCLCNAGFTLITLKIGLPAYGFGYAAAGFVAVISGFFVMDNRLKNLGYYTFMRQPVFIPKFKYESEWALPKKAT